MKSKIKLGLFTLSVAALVTFFAVDSFSQGSGRGYGHMGYGQGMGPGYGHMGYGQGMGPGYGHMGYGYGMGPGYGHMGYGYGMGPGYGHMYGNGSGRMGYMKDWLGLSDSQVKKIFKIDSKYREKFFENRGNPDKIYSLRKEYDNEVRNVLTKKQREKFSSRGYGRGGYGRGWSHPCGSW